MLDLAKTHPHLVSNSIRQGLTTDFGLTKESVTAEMSKLVLESYDKLVKDQSFEALLDKSVDRIINRELSKHGGLINMIRYEVNKQVQDSVKKKIDVLVKDACAAIGRA